MTLRCSPVRSQNAVRIVSTCSLLLVLIGQVFAGPYADFAKRLRVEKAGANTAWMDAYRSTLSDVDLKAQIDVYLNAERSSRAEEFEQLRSVAESLAAVEEISPAADAAKKVEQIKSSPIYRDAGSAEGSSWLGKAMDRLKFKPPDAPKVNPKLAGLDVAGTVVIWLAWILLGAAVVVFLLFAARHIRWKAGLRKKATALLDDGEPDRTVDEWLLLADEQAAQGKFREAVRSLYLACLMRFDDAGVARFERSQTNWEHLGRIMASATRPPTLDFTAATQRFDRVWYGHQVEGMRDVEEMRAAYISITASVREVRAA